MTEVIRNRSSEQWMRSGRSIAIALLFVAASVAASETFDSEAAEFNARCARWIHQTALPDSDDALNALFNGDNVRIAAYPHPVGWRDLTSGTPASGVDRSATHAMLIIEASRSSIRNGALELTDARVRFDARFINDSSVTNRPSSEPLDYVFDARASTIRLYSSAFSPTRSRPAMNGILIELSGGAILKLTQSDGLSTTASDAPRPEISDARFDAQSITVFLYEIPDTDNNATQPKSVRQRTDVLSNAHSVLRVRRSRDQAVASFHSDRALALIDNGDINAYFTGPTMLDSFALPTISTFDSIQLSTMSGAMARIKANGVAEVDLEGRSVFRSARLAAVSESGASILTSKAEADGVPMTSTIVVFPGRFAALLRTQTGDARFDGTQLSANLSQTGNAGDLQATVESESPMTITAFNWFLSAYRFNIDRQSTVAGAGYQIEIPPSPSPVQAVQSPSVPQSSEGLGIPFFLNDVEIDAIRLSNEEAFK